MEELELSEEWFEDTWKELEQARGEKLIAGRKKRSKSSGKNVSKSDEITLTFEDTDNLDLEETYQINIKADCIVVGKHDTKKGTVKSVGLGQLKGKRFLEYIAWHDDNIVGPVLQLTMAFEKGYSIEISGSTVIEEIKSK